jgi:hypothetical protein
VNDDMAGLNVQFPESAFAALRKDPGMLASEMRLAAAVKRNGLSMICQEKPDEIVGLSRAEFISALNRLHISSFQ